MFDFEKIEKAHMEWRKSEPYTEVILDFGGLDLIFHMGKNKMKVHLWGEGERYIPRAGAIKLAKRILEVYE